MMISSCIRPVLFLAISTSITACGGSGSHPASATSADSDTSSGSTVNQIQHAAIDYSLIADQALSDCVSRTEISDTAQLQILNCNSQDIATVAGIEQFGELRVLSLRQNQLTDISAIRTLSKLSHLDISHNRVTSVTGPASVTTLNAAYNHISAIDTLTELPLLQRLYINNNAITDLSPLSGLLTVRHLTADNNPASLPATLPDSLESFRI
ncbi:MAG: leucine-rich repeat domain-containing protein [Pseudomonadota bacterium]|nr:leucine-rich repeat domain-containing protein [Pseudomonadota bacterium]